MHCADIFVVACSPSINALCHILERRQSRAGSPSCPQFQKTLALRTFVSQQFFHPCHWKKTSQWSQTRRYPRHQQPTRPYKSRGRREHMVNAVMNSWRDPQIRLRNSLYGQVLFTILRRQVCRRLYLQVLRPSR